MIHRRWWASAAPAPAYVFMFSHSDGTVPPLPRRNAARLRELHINSPCPGGRRLGQNECSRSGETSGDAWQDMESASPGGHDHRSFRCAVCWKRSGFRALPSSKPWQENKWKNQSSLGRFLIPAFSRQRVRSCPSASTRACFSTFVSSRHALINPAAIVAFQRPLGRAWTVALARFGC